MMTPASLKDSIVAPDGTRLGALSVKIPYNEKPCGNCNEPTGKTYWAMYRGSSQQTKVLKETQVVEGSMHAAMLARYQVGADAVDSNDGIFRSNYLHAAAFPNDECEAWTKKDTEKSNKSARCRRDISCKWNNAVKICEKKGFVEYPQTLPDWVGILALNHYQKRARGACKWKSNVVKTTGSIFVNKHFDRSERRLVLLDRCTPPQSVHRVQDVTLATEGPLIWEKLSEIFGPEAKQYQLDEQHRYRDMVAKFMKAHPEHYVDSDIPDAPWHPPNRSLWGPGVHAHRT